MQYDLNAPRKRRLIKRVRLKRMLAALLVLYGIITIINVIIQQEAMLAKQQTDAAALRRQIEEVQMANAELENKLQFTETSQYIERIARDQLGYVKEGEIKIDPK